ncbi:hypothetical protein HDU67_005764, partial [Dinochytrium kinnereticum]
VPLKIQPVSKEVPVETAENEGEAVKMVGLEKTDSMSTIPELLLPPSRRVSHVQELNVHVGVNRGQRTDVPKRSTLTKQPLSASLNFSLASLNPSQILRSPIFWLYTTSFTFQQGLTYITNLSSIVTSLDPTSTGSKDALIALHITLTSVFQSLGRLVTGLIVDLPAFSSKRHDRSDLFLYAMTFLTLPHLIVAVMGSAGTLTQSGLLFCSACIG